MDLTDIMGVSDSDRILISQHAKNRMFERSINLEDILSCLAEYIYLITVYYPNDEIWKEGYRERR